MRTEVACCSSATCSFIGLIGSRRTANCTWSAPGKGLIGPKWPFERCMYLRPHASLPPKGPASPLKLVLINKRHMYGTCGLLLEYCARRYYRADRSVQQHRSSTNRSLPAGISHRVSGGSARCVCTRRSGVCSSAHGDTGGHGQAQRGSTLVAELGLSEHQGSPRPQMWFIFAKKI